MPSSITPNFLNNLFAELTIIDDITINNGFSELLDIPTGTFLNIDTTTDFSQ